MNRAGNLPEAAFRRHASWKRNRGWWLGPRGGAMWLLGTVASSLSTYISLIGQNSTSALLSPSTWPSYSLTTFCVMCEKMQPSVKPNALTLTLTLPQHAKFWLWKYFYTLPFQVFLWGGEQQSCELQRREQTSFPRLETSKREVLLM